MRTKIAAHFDLLFVYVVELIFKSQVIYVIILGYTHLTSFFLISAINNRTFIVLNLGNLPQYSRET